MQLITNNNCAIVISSCDSFFDTWEIFFELFHKYWPDCPFPVYLITNYKEFSDNRINPIAVGEDKKWASNLKNALNTLPHKYILYLQEDYFLKKKIENKKILDCLKVVQKENAAYLRLVPVPKPDQNFKKFNNIGLIAPGSAYRTSLQAAIWKTDILKSLLINGNTGWDMELDSCEKLNQIDLPFLCVKKTVFHYYITGIVKGKWERGVINFLKKEKIDNIDFTRRGIEPAFPYYKRRLRQIPFFGTIFKTILLFTEKYQRLKNDK